MPEIFGTHYELLIVTLGSAILGVISGALGAFAVLRKQSLLGDAISHAALPGIALAFLLTHSRQPLVLVAGAATAGWIATLLVSSIVRNTRIKEDSALGLVMSVFFGFGLVLLTFIQKHVDTSGKAGLDKLLFGQAAALLASDLLAMALLGAAALCIMLLFWKELKLLSFDPEFGACLGYPMRLLDTLLTTLLVIAIVVGLQTVGVVLMSAMVVAPAAAARQWTDRLGHMVGLAAFFGACAGLFGALLSSTTAKLPTGPTIVLCLTLITALSLVLAPNRGMFWAWARQRANRQRLGLEMVLADLQQLACQHPGQAHGHPLAVIRAMSGGQAGVAATLQELTRRGWATEVSPGMWTLTTAGGHVADSRSAERGQTHDS